eukprot:7589040-Pyramimonas_sp.AAC.1
MTPVERYAMRSRRMWLVESGRQKAESELEPRECIEFGPRRWSKVLTDVGVAKVSRIELPLLAKLGREGAR